MGYAAFGAEVADEYGCEAAIRRMKVEDRPGHEGRSGQMNEHVWHVWGNLWIEWLVLRKDEGMHKRGDKGRVNAAFCHLLFLIAMTGEHAG